MSHSELVSVIIPVYNRLDDLKRAINSVLNQSHQNFELLICDDGSEEDVRSVVDSFEDKRIKYFRTLNHGNANIARNLGTEKAQGAYIAQLDSDDEFLPQHLERRLEKIKEWSCDGIYGSAIISDDNGERIQLAGVKSKHHSWADFFFDIGFSQTSSLFYKTAIREKVKWDESLTRFQDGDFKIEFSKHFRFCPDLEVTTKIHWENRAPKVLATKVYTSILDKHRAILGDAIVSTYCLGVYKNALNKGQKETEKEFKKRCKALVNQFSLVQYMALYPKASRIKRYYAYFEFAFLNLFQAFKQHFKNLANAQK